MMLTDNKHKHQWTEHDVHVYTYIHIAAADDIVEIDSTLFATTVAGVLAACLLVPLMVELSNI